jgi:hypothetical protein
MMFPNNDEIMYRYSKMHAKEIHDEVESARDDQVHAHILRRRMAVLAALVLVGLTLAVTILALGWWML